MALSDYLTDKEWNGMFYMFTGPRKWHDFGECMHAVIQELLKVGYRFEGLDEEGKKKQRVGDDINGPKLAYLFEQAFGDSGYVSGYKIDALSLLAEGRAFIKEHVPHLLHESDETWEEAYECARACLSTDQAVNNPSTYLAYYRHKDNVIYVESSATGGYRVVSADLGRAEHVALPAEELEVAESTFRHLVQDALKGK